MSAFHNKSHPVPPGFLNITRRGEAATIKQLDAVSGCTTGSCRGFLASVHQPPEASCEGSHSTPYHLR
ncbi:hypothetical protein PDJAM_G00206400 [Pangasius djambal]|uniref:Uncharacterized protein n=1 Tax=Pangasius djambal TaxID=1691987 RepID=A0ACC5Y8T1_9TELE|nr:hypothetical protein [Pangasius djambal]